jgi:hypothetical protein
MLLQLLDVLQLLLDVGRTLAAGTGLLRICVAAVPCLLLP